MSYEPEILVSRERDVLQELRSPFTHAVCWDARGDDEFMGLVENVEGIHALTDGMWEFTESKLALELRANDVFQPNMVYSSNMLGGLLGVIGDRICGHNIDSGVRSWFNLPGDVDHGTSWRPHVDSSEIGVFFSFNRYARASSCVPLQFAGEKTDNFHYSLAGFDRAIEFPKASVYMIDLGRQLHFGPKTVPLDKWRVFAHATYDYKPFSME